MQTLIPAPIDHPTALIRTAAPLVAAALCLLAGCASQLADKRPEHEPPYLGVIGGEVRTRNGLDYRLTIPAGFRTSPIDSRQDRFNGHPFDISRIVLIADDRAVMMHAETVADGSSASNYDDLPTATLAGLPFHVRPESCENLTPADIEGEHDLQWLSAQGFAPTGPLRIAQYLSSTDDHNAELVITLMVRVADCESGDSGASLNRLQDTIEIRHR